MSFCYGYRPSFYNSNQDTAIKKIILETTGSINNLEPEYLFEIDVESRKVFFNGKKNTKKIGIHRGILPSFSIEFLVDFFQESYFFAMNESFTIGRPELSIAKITVFLKCGKIKRVTFDRYAKPAMLLALKMAIDNELNKNVVWFD